MQVMFKGDIYHCRYCHNDYRYRGEVTGCTQDCCHGADEPLTPDEVWKQYQKKQKQYEKIKK